MIQATCGWLACVFLAGCVAAPTRIADIAGRARPPTSHHIALAKYFRQLRSVDVRIEGRSYSFLVDTAGGRTLVSPRLAAAMLCTPRGRDVGYRMNGDPVVFQVCPRLRASVAGFDLDLAPVAVFDLSAVLPSELPPLDGVLALDAFRGQILALDWAKNELVVVGTSGDASYPAPVPLRYATGENGGSLTVLVPVSSAGNPAWFLVDSGDIRGTLLGRHLVRDGFVSPAADSTVRLGVGKDAEESMNVIVDDINFDGVLGAHYLVTHTITLDLRGAP